LNNLWGVLFRVMGVGSEGQGGRGLPPGFLYMADIVDRGL